MQNRCAAWGGQNLVPDVAATSYNTFSAQHQEILFVGATNNQYSPQLLPQAQTGVEFTGKLSSTKGLNLSEKKVLSAKPVLNLPSRNIGEKARSRVAKMMSMLVLVEPVGHNSPLIFLHSFGGHNRSDCCPVSSTQVFNSTLFPGMKLLYGAPNPKP